MKHSRKCSTCYNTQTCFLISVHILNPTFCSSSSWITTVHVLRSRSSCMPPNIKGFGNIKKRRRRKKKTPIRVLDVNCSWKKNAIIKIPLRSFQKRERKLKGSFPRVRLQASFTGQPVNVLKQCSWSLSYKSCNFKVSLKIYTICCPIY